ncbi:MAG: ROK family transcriptional regulator [Pyrinomonadaceae bacterium]|nr:ROK family transcriptional regulator [Pyrinomonadaceae bacterium]
MRRIYLQKAKSQVARADTIRNINRQIVLNYVRDREPISRAEIARETDLQRSTVSSIVNALVEDGFVEEIGAGESSGGRKPTMLKLRTDEVVAIGVDITPTVINIATANLAGEIIHLETFPTSPDRAQNFQKIVKKISAIKTELKTEDVKIGLSVPGLVDEVSVVVTYVPYFHWENWKIKDEIKDATGLSVVIDNDANAIALADLWFGMPEVDNIKNFASLLVAEGIGTGIIFDGQIYRGNKGAAGEFGHMLIGDADKENNNAVCSCGNTHCWESFASNRATIRRFNNLTGSADGASDISRILTLARQNDAAALQAINETARYLGLGIVNLLVGLSPEAVIVSGEITLVWSLIEKTLLKTIEENIKQKLPTTLITASTLGASPTLKGAICLSIINKFASRN